MIFLYFSENNKDDIGKGHSSYKTKQIKSEYRDLKMEIISPNFQTRDSLPGPLVIIDNLQLL